MWNKRSLAGLGAVALIAAIATVHGQAGPGATATSPSLKQLQSERLQCAEAMLAVAVGRAAQMAGTQADVGRARRLVLECQLDMVQTAAQRIAIAQEQVVVCEKYLQFLETQVATGRIPAAEMAYARYDLAEARVTLAKMQAAM